MKKKMYHTPEGGDWRVFKIAHLSLKGYSKPKTMVLKKAVPLQLIVAEEEEESVDGRT